MLALRKASDASVAMEIKVVDSWTIRELEAALEDQLCGRYLRAKDARQGILLLVHRKARKNGWKDPRRRCFLSFNQLVDHLKALAAQITGGAGCSAARNRRVQCVRRGKDERPALSRSGCWVLRFGFPNIIRITNAHAKDTNELH